MIPFPRSERMTRSEHACVAQHLTMIIETCALPGPILLIFFCACHFAHLHIETADYTHLLRRIFSISHAQLNATVKRKIYVHLLGFIRWLNRVHFFFFQPYAGFREAEGWCSRASSPSKSPLPLHRSKRLRSLEETGEAHQPEPLSTPPFDISSKLTETYSSTFPTSPNSLSLIFPVDYPRPLQFLRKWGDHQLLPRLSDTVSRGQPGQVAD